MNWDRITAISSVIIALCSFILTTYEIHETRKHYHLSVRPTAMISWYNRSDGAGWEFQTGGIGPLELHSFKVEIDNKEVNSWHELVSVLKLPEPGQFYFLIPYPRVLYSPNSRSPIFWVISKPNTDILLQEYLRVNIEICYCSLYEDCWKYSFKEGTRQVGKCLDSTWPGTFSE